MISEAATLDLDGVAQTLLIPLYLRASESERPDALLKDEKAVALVRRMSRDFDPVRKVRMLEVHKVTRIMLTREMDRYARDFLSRHPAAVVVHIGCGLDSRFERVDNGQVEWFDLDLPEVIDLRRRLIGGEGERYHLLPCSALEDAWLDMVSAYREHSEPSERPLLFLAETVFVYFPEPQVRSLVVKLRDRFAGAELVFDAWTPFNVWVGRRWLSSSTFAGLMQWGIWRGRDIEAWGRGIRLLDQWGFFDRPEPRLERFRLIAPLARRLKIPSSIYHFQLGEAAA